MSDWRKEALGWGAVLLVGVVAFVVTRPRTPPVPPRPPGPPKPPTEAAPARASLGVKVVVRDGALSVAEVYTGSNAARAGLVAGDVIVAVEGQPAAEPRVLLERLDALRPGEPLALTLRAQGGGTRELRLVLDAGHGFELDLARRLIAAGAAQLAAAGRPDGRWPHYQDPARPSVAVTALVAHALARAGEDAPDAARQALDRARATLLAAQAADGGLDDPAERPPHRVYATALAVLALERGPARARLVEWLVQAQVQEAHGFDAIDARYGGWSYHDAYESARLRTDVSTARFALEALGEAGLPDDAAVWDRARLWLDATQNRALITRPGEAGHERERALRDGGFAFGPRASKAGSDPLGPTLTVWRSYGSATADGALARLALDGVDERRRAPGALRAGDDALAALRWLARRWDLTKNPGFEQDAVGWAGGIVFYHLAALAEALHRAGVGRVLPPGGGPGHDWAAELVRRLGTLHGRAGDRFRGESPLMHEDSPTLAAAFAVLALCAARDRLALGGGADLDAGAPPEPRPPDGDLLAPPRDAVARGLAVFRRAGCAGCHVDGGAGNGPGLSGVAERALLRWRTAPAAAEGLAAFVRAPDPARAFSRGEWPPMPPVGPAQLSDADLADVVQFLLSRRADMPVSEAR